MSKKALDPSSGSPGWALPHFPRQLPKPLGLGQHQVTASVPPQKSDCRSMLFSIQGPDVRGEPQAGANNQGKKPSFYDLGMGQASHRALFSFLHPRSHPSQDPKASTSMWSLPWQDFKGRTHHQPRVKKGIFSLPPTAPIQ